MYIRKLNLLDIYLSYLSPPPTLCCFLSTKSNAQLVFHYQCAYHCLIHQGSHKIFFDLAPPPMKKTKDNHTSLYLLLRQSAAAAAAKHSSPEKIRPTSNVVFDLPKVIPFHLIRAYEASDQKIENPSKCQGHDCAGENNDVVWHAKIWRGQRE